MNTVVFGRPAGCRNRLRDEGKPHPKSGCSVCETGGIAGCPYEREVADERALKIIGEIGKVKLEPGDVLIVSCPGRVTAETMHRLRSTINEVFANHKYVILADGVKIEVARPGRRAVDLTDEMVVAAMAFVPGCDHDDMVSALEAALDLEITADAGRRVVE